jgi:AraC-like DNA-binding protein
MPMIDSVVERFKPVRQIDGTTGSRLLCRTERFLIFERRFYSDDPLRAQELEPSEGWCEFVVSLRPPDPQHLTCPRTQYADARYLHHHLVVRVEPDYLRHLLAPEAERVLEELLPFVRGEAPLPDQLYLMTANPLVRSVVDSLLHPPPVGSLRLFYEAKLRELMAFLCFREPAVVASQDASRLHQAIAYLEAHLSEPDALQKMTRQMGVSSRQCQRLFRVVIGRSPSECLTELRMRRAATLLQTTRLRHLRDCAGGRLSQFEATSHASSTAISGKPRAPSADKPASTPDKPYGAA